MDITFGIIGGTGMLGRAIARGLLEAGVVQEEKFWLSNRSGTADGFRSYPGLNVTTDNQSLAEACDVILLCVPPALANDVSIAAAGKLILSVMAGVGLERLATLSGSDRVVRAMSSPAAELRLAFSPWVASGTVTEADKAVVRRLFGAIGAAAEVSSEAQVELFTALTGPVPGFVAFFAECMADYAVAEGVSPDVADRAVRQLFLSAGRMMAEGDATPGDHVQEMIDYAGTTAAGLTAMRSSAISRDVAAALAAAVEKTRNM